MMLSALNILDRYTNTMFVFLLALCVTSASANSLSRIVNGEDTTIEEHPHQVSLAYYGSHSCGGSLISTNWVLTAAHCVDGDATQISNLKVELNNGNRFAVLQTFNVSQVIIHGSYNKGTGAFPNDIALLELDGVVETAIHSAITLPTTNQNFDEANCEITGWGRLEGGGALPDQLQKTSGVILTSTQCSSVWGNNYNHKNHICIHDSNTGSCNGDSGGPMVCGGVLAGVTSWGQSGCITASPSVYTRVTNYLTWIAQTTGITIPE